MNYETTKHLLDAISPYYDLTKISVLTENKDYRGHHYQSDFVTLDKNNNVHFEVFDNEIIISYFTDHKHFEDYTFELEEREPNFVARAIDFLVSLFKVSIYQIEVCKGNKLVYEKYYFVYPNGDEECVSGIIRHKLLFGFNPFAQKSINVTIWKYNFKENCFTKY